MDKAVHHRYGCACNDPQCASYVLGRICEMIGEDIPMFTPEVVAEGLGICSACVEDFIEEHATSHNMDAVLAGTDRLNGLPFVMRYRMEDGTGLRLLSPKPGHEDAFMKYYGRTATPTM